MEVVSPQILVSYIRQIRLDQAAHIVSGFASGL